MRRAFDRAAATYDGAAAVQREICALLAAFASARPHSAPARVVLDAGCGTGYALEWLAQRFPDGALVALDFAPAMLARIPLDVAGRTPLRLCADLEALPLATGSVDVVWSSLALQWCDPAAAFVELARALRPGGVAWVATLGPRTLWELRDAFAAVDDAEHAIRFHAPEHWLDAAAVAGLVAIAREHRPAFALAPDLRALLRDIKAIGAHSVGSGRRRKPLGRSAWRTLEARYETHRRPDGLLPATYDLILLALTKPAAPFGADAPTPADRPGRSRLDGDSRDA